jgi:hypothetical protein
MSDFTLTIPEDVYERVRKIAETHAAPIEDVMLSHLRNMAIPLPVLPPDEQQELDALRYLSDDALWTIAKEQMPHDIQERMQVLMDANNFGTITDTEYAELAGYVERGNRLTLRKSEAAARIFCL